MTLCVDTIGTTTKIRKLSTGHIIACSGVHDTDKALMRWYEQGADVDKWPKVQDDKDRFSNLIVVTPDGQAFYYCQLPEPIPVEEPFKAWGCGREAALGAMEMGASAIKAVEVASKWVAGCGRGCDWFEIGKQL